MKRANNRPARVNPPRFARYPSDDSHATTGAEAVEPSLRAIRTARATEATPLEPGPAGIKPADLAGAEKPGSPGPRPATTVRSRGSGRSPGPPRPGRNPSGAAWRDRRGGPCGQSPPPSPNISRGGQVDRCTPGARGRT